MSLWGALSRRSTLSTLCHEIRCLMPAAPILPDSSRVMKHDSTLKSPPQLSDHRLRCCKRFKTPTSGQLGVSKPFTSGQDGSMIHHQINKKRGSFSQLKLPNRSTADILVPDAKGHLQSSGGVHCLRCQSCFAMRKISIIVDSSFNVVVTDAYAGITLSKCRGCWVIGGRCERWREQGRREGSNTSHKARGHFKIKLKT